MKTDLPPSSTHAANGGAADAVVVGGGIVGICTARYLQRSGRTVTVIERGRPGDGASGHNGGVFNVGECVPTGTPGVLRSVPKMLRDPMSPLVIRYRYLPRLAPWLTRFVLASRASRVEQIAVALQSLTARAMDGYQPLLEGTTAEPLVHTGGALFAYRHHDVFARDRFAHDLRTRRAVKFDLLDDTAITALDPALAGRFERGVHLPEAHFTNDPERLTRELAAQFTANGGTLLHASVDRLERRNGRVHAVATTTGSIRTDTVVIAAGAWSRRLVRQLGLDVPLDTERGYGVHLPDPGITVKLPVIVPDFHVAFRATPTGLQLSGVDELASVSAPPDYALADRIIRAAQIIFPELRTDGATRWMHCRPSLPDSLPIIGAVPRYPNAYLAFGHGHKGLCLGAITGKLVQELIDDKPTSVDVEPFSPTRFSLRPRRAGRTQP
ncbi:MAG: NAD(P)/FAD-dependent oxidoreductase [Acidimicrobiales bacterium]